MTQLTDTQKKQEVWAQLHQMCCDVEETLRSKADHAIRSGSIPDDYFEEGSYLLAKAIFDAWCRDRNFAPPSHNKQAIREYDNIYTCI